MRNNMYRLVAVSSFQILAVVMLMGSQTAFGQGNRPAAPVTVTNDPGNPVPTVITGTTSISGDVNARQGGSWTVNVGNIPSVEAQQSGVWKFAIDPLHNVVDDPGVNTRLDTANSHLANIDTATSQLRFDGSGNLKTAPQGTQNVNIVGGTISSAPSLASREEFIDDTIDPGANSIYKFNTPINGSTILINTQNDIDVQIIPFFPNGGSSFSLGHITGGQLVVINLTQQIPIGGFIITNPALLTHATFIITVLGN
jgi:hypothetical protein